MRCHMHEDADGTMSFTGKPKILSLELFSISCELMRLRCNSSTTASVSSQPSPIRWSLGGRPLPVHADQTADMEEKAAAEVSDPDGPVKVTLLPVSRDL